jgi:phage gpG-like protein
MSKITVDVNDARAIAQIDELLKRAGGRELYGVIGNTILNRIRLCFRLGIDPWGDAWRPIKWRAARTRANGSRTKTGNRQASANAAGTPGQPLRDTGRLNRSITSKADRSGVTIGTNLIYAPVHQFGATIVPVNAKRLVFPGPNGALIFAKKSVIPARPFLPLRQGGIVALPPAWSAVVVRAIKRHLLVTGG